ncbi:MAG: hypothetical protein PHW18_04375 [Sulfuricurvum sp.]|uniref:hypothetical protein n=1 Tax=Sulfuricurvum sp. TaxID=2025608 RepID=UPI0026027D22|nr:hypothetical protein [Sulfuricurvum sp.]MDD2828790.1 hypothetical protein [Sulfuricurvum sp.]MDD4948751.1 hypothetical protein [Sulfuricurvum sp.]
MQAMKIVASSLQEALKQGSLTSGVESDKIDFDLLTYRTYYRGTVDEEWRLLENNTRLEAVTTEVEIRSSPFEVRQEYEFILHSPQPHPVFDLRLTLAMDKYRSKAIAIIDPSSKIPLKKGIQEYIKQELHRKKLQAGLHIGITDNDFDTQINQLLLKIQKEGPLQAPYRMAITDYFPPLQPTDDAIILHYKKNSNVLIEGAKVDDLIFEYIYAAPGRSGRSCSGEYIGVDEPKIRYATALNIDHNSLRAHEDSYSIKFYATQSGFVERTNGIFAIGHELRLKKAGFKETGSIEAGADKEIHVKIDHKDNSKDAVGSGVNIDVQTLDVNGTVGSNTKIQACDVTIGAQTHKKSLIEVQENATIHLHRGDLKAKNATIEILEAGKVEAVTVHVTKMMGGEIIAENVIIDTLYSNARITALKSIEIHTILGEGNNLIIDPRAIASYQEQITLLENELHASAHYLQQKGKELLAKELSLKGQMNRIKQTQLKIKAANERNEQPLKADIVRVQQFKSALSDLHKEQQDIHAYEEEMRTKGHELEKLLDADLHATITHHTSYNGHTRIHFIDPKNSQKYAISPQKYVKLITLRREGEDKKIVLEV